MPASSFSLLSFKPGPSFLALCLSLLAAIAAAGQDNRFCGGAVSTTSPDDLANVVGDQSLEFIAQQPASMITCSKGYMLEKCGDHETANLIFDKCIAAGYPGAMIWKALLLQDGAGVEPDLPRAAALLHQAAVSGDPAYGPIGKMHYATMLHLGKGVARDEAEALKWFQAAAAEGNEEAREFLKTGYHTGYRDERGMGAGVPTAQALAKGRWEDDAAQPRPAREAARRGTPNPNPADGPSLARKLETSGAATPPPPAPIRPATAPAQENRVADIQGQKLERLAPPAPPAAAAAAASASAGLGLLLLASFVAGLLRQARRRARPPVSFT